MDWTKIVISTISAIVTIVQTVTSYYMSRSDRDNKDEPSCDKLHHNVDGNTSDHGVCSEKSECYLQDDADSHHNRDDRCKRNDDTDFDPRC